MDLNISCTEKNMRCKRKWPQVQLNGENEWSTKPMNQYKRLYSGSAVIVVVVVLTRKSQACVSFDDIALIDQLKAYCQTENRKSSTSLKGKKRKELT